MSARVARGREDEEERSRVTGVIAGFFSFDRFLSDEVGFEK